MHQKKVCNSHEAGFTLLQVIVMVSLLAVVATMVFRASVQSNQAKKIIRAGQNYEDINQLFINELAAVLKNPAGTQCFAPNDFSKPLSAGLSASEMKHTKNIEAGVSKDVKAAMSRSSSIGKALDRCKDRVRTITNGSSATDNKLHFCLKFDQVATAPRNSFLNSEHAFAEVAIHLKDFHSDSDLSCADYKTSTAAGAQIFYSLFWTTEVGGKLRYKRKNGVFHTGK
ncbi:type II secretion system protein [Pseudobacteriovorax antillogorgiicola]|uniref:Uncharacterized protein n=1 Tax=Pseudobacteriovorax antillogorgiicola TaxID=1513793 RepID=A0A1Y6BIW3_9BACT|nr:hypothetical protein [Pseudobacteriovorax antillogorgiicola]TCS55415.1 hypothetical protein EDD56_105136 [Pseudobacteriovorax antillogorgiicola]SMF12655.1 hypothetical protein SAMN06296036_105188 [Pseudobacteriovorax antillogorgiicola]